MVGVERSSVSKYGAVLTRLPHYIIYRRKLYLHRGI
jgi:hypothetical protein